MAPPRRPTVRRDVGFGVSVRASSAVGLDAVRADHTSDGVGRQHLSYIDKRASLLDGMLAQQESAKPSGPLHDLQVAVCVSATEPCQQHANLPFGEFLPRRLGVGQVTSTLLLRGPFSVGKRYVVVDAITHRRAQPAKPGT